MQYSSNVSLSSFQKQHLYFRLQTKFSNRAVFYDNKRKNFCFSFGHKKAQGGKKTKMKSYYIQKGMEITMAEYCLDCFNKMENTHLAKNQVVESAYPYLCEGCKQQKKIVIRVRRPLFKRHRFR